MGFCARYWVNESGGGFSALGGGISALILHLASWFFQVVIGHNWIEENSPGMRKQLTLHSVILSPLLAWTSIEEEDIGMKERTEEEEEASHKSADPRGRITDSKGRLKHLWRFPSDHLPVGCQCNVGPSSSEAVVVVSWNLMSSRFPISNLVSQGLKGSLPYEQYKKKGHGANVSLRDCTVLKILSTWILKGSYKADVLALQECSKHVLKKLTPLLKMEGWGIVDEHRHFPDAIVLYDKKRLGLVRSRVTMPFSLEGRAIRWATFKFEDGGVCNDFTVANGKIPGNPNGQHLEEWARHISKMQCAETNDDESQSRLTSQSQVTEPNRRAKFSTLFLGDFNFTEREVREALSDAPKMEFLPCFVKAKAGEAYVTNMTPEVVPDGFGGGPFASKRIDHIMLLNPYNKPDIDTSSDEVVYNNDKNIINDARLIPPNELLPGLEDEVATLQHSGRPHSMVPEPSAHTKLWECYPEAILKDVHSWQASQPAKKREAPPTLW